MRNASGRLCICGPGVDLKGAYGTLNCPARRTSGPRLLSLAGTSIHAACQARVFKQKLPQPRLAPSDRLFWVMLRRFWLSRHRARVGRKCVTRELRELIFRMVAENPARGSPRLHGELKMLGFDISERTVLRWMRKAPRSPEPAKRWAAFLSNHREAIAAMDFLTVPTLTFGVQHFAKPHARIAAIRLLAGRKSEIAAHDKLRQTVAKICVRGSVAVPPNCDVLGEQTRSRSCVVCRPLPERCRVDLPGCGFSKTICILPSASNRRR